MLLESSFLVERLSKINEIMVALFYFRLYFEVGCGKFFTKKCFVKGTAHAIIP